MPEPVPEPVLTEEQEQRLANWINEESDSEEEFKRLGDANKKLQENLEKIHEHTKLNKYFSNMTERISTINNGKTKRRTIYFKKKQRPTVLKSQFRMKLF